MNFLMIHAIIDQLICLQALITILVERYMYNVPKVPNVCLLSYTLALLRGAQGGHATPPPPPPPVDWRVEKMGRELVYAS